MTENEIELEALNTKIRQQRETITAMDNTDSMKDFEMTALKHMNILADDLRKSIERDRVKNDCDIITSKLNAILDKNNCLRVRFLDWLASKLENWAEGIRNYAMSISKPCIIKVPVKSETNSRL